MKTEETNLSWHKRMDRFVVGITVVVITLFFSWSLMGRFAKGRFGQILDSFLVMGTIFGIATSVGFGIMQLASGLNTLFNIPTTTMVYQIIAAIWCAI